MLCGMKKLLHLRNRVSVLLLCTPRFLRKLSAASKVAPNNPQQPVSMPCTVPLHAASVMIMEYVHWGWVPLWLCLVLSCITAPGKPLPHCETFKQCYGEVSVARTWGLLPAPICHPDESATLKVDLPAQVILRMTAALANLDSNSMGDMNLEPPS